jgi:two-component system sensor histidine kinase YesM
MTDGNAAEHMSRESGQHRSRSLRGSVLAVLVALSAVLLLVVTLFSAYSVKRQMDRMTMNRTDRLNLYSRELDYSMQSVSNYIRNSIANDADFQALIFAEDERECYGSSVAVGSKYKALLWSLSSIRLLATYNKSCDYFHGTWNSSNHADYPHEDIMRIRNSITESAGAEAGSQWLPVMLTDRIVFVYVNNYRETVFAALIDPAWQSQENTEEGSMILTVLQDGTVCQSGPWIVGAHLPEGDTATDDTGSRWQILRYPLMTADAQAIYISPYISPMGTLEPMQRLLFILVICLLAVIPVSWLVMNRWLLKPFQALTDTLHAIKSGQSDTRVREQTGLAEVDMIAGTVNEMLDTIRQQQIESYEHRLEAQHAQLQYLQVQIRPHFFLNCMNMIFSMAQEQRYDDIQELVLNLSVYLRSTFRNSANLIPLREELRSVTSYVRIWQCDSDDPPQLRLDIPDAGVEEVTVPPLSILSFVENSIKHCRKESTTPEIHIRCHRLPGDGEEFLNVTIADNCGGFPEEALTALNSPETEIYRDRNVGTINVKQRLRLMYGGKAAITFANRADGACVDIYIPIEDSSHPGAVQ